MTLQGLSLGGILLPKEQLYTQEARELKIFLVAAFIMIFFNAVSLAQDPPSYSKDSARRLIIQLNRSYTLIDRSLKELEGEIKKFPDTTLILSALNKSGDIGLLSLDAWDDTRLLGGRTYTAIENEALKAGGRDQLYQGEVKEGSRNLRLEYYWRTEGNPAQKGEALIPISISKGMSYFIDLSLEKRGEDVKLYHTLLEFNSR